MNIEPVRCGCGGYARVVLDWYPDIVPCATGTMYKVHCVSCGCSVTSGTKKGAVEKWNTAMRGNYETLKREGDHE